MKMFTRLKKSRQRGAAAVEFALVATWFFLLLLGILELGRILYVWNTVQEVTRRAARSAVVKDFGNTNDMNWVVTDAASPGQGNSNGSKVSWPAAPEVSCTSFANCTIQVTYWAYWNGQLSGPIDSSKTSLPEQQVTCEFPDRANQIKCIRFVKATISGVTYYPMFLPFGNFPLPDSTVTMPAEALGLL